MAIPIAAPKLGWATEPVEIVEWKAKEGEWVEKGSTILVVSTGKITSDVEAESSGYLHIVVQAGAQVPIGSTVGFIAQSEEELESIKKEAPAPPTPKEEGIEEAQEERERIRISPLARKLAQEHMIDITKIVGSGPQGRIVKEDIERAIEAKEKGAPKGKEVRSTIPLRGMRRAIAEHMHQSLQSSAQVTLMGEIDAAELVKWHKSLASKVGGIKITYTDLFVFLISRVLKNHPIINSSLIDDEIKLWDDINIGVAVALEDGLLVPVVKNADKKSLLEISREIKTLVEKARGGKLLPEEIEDGTFTITNLGALGGGYRFETVIINQPQSAILGTGGITDRAVVRDGEIVVRPVMTYYLTYDHRVITGAMAASFMADVVKLLENPGPLLSEEEAKIKQEERMESRMHDTRELIKEVEASLAKLGQDYPNQRAAFSELTKSIEAPGALDRKYKELIAIAISIIKQCHWCVAFHTRNALACGATKEEIMEASWVAVQMGGGPALAHLQLVQKALEDLASDTTW